MCMSDILIVVPTYNERENIGTLIDDIATQPSTVDILVIDDGSPDGTADIVREKQKHIGEERLKLVVRAEGKAGRGSACLYGFRYALDHGYRAAIEMDADLSHNPADIPRFIERLDDADVIVGSKYVRGGKVIGWGWYRTLLSRGANLYARMILRLPIHDYTNGYRCYGPRALRLIPHLPIDGTGFTVIPQMSFFLHRAGLKFVEIPITFTNRRRGTSNMSLKEVTESFLTVLKLRFKH